MALNRSLLRATWQDWMDFRLDARGPAWLQWAWTAVFCVGVAAAITLLDLFIGAQATLARLQRAFVVNLAISLSIGFLIQVLVAAGVWLIGIERLRRWSTRRTALLWGVIGVLAVLVGWPLGLSLAGGDFFAFAHRHPMALRSALVFSLLLTAGFVLWFAARAARAEAERRASEARLRLLQAQIEPHFLFNTLANVLSLLEHDTPRARRMLESFVDYLRSSLVELRREQTTVAAELVLAQAYLELLQVRMEDRLRFRIDADADARAAALPPLLLQPLVENAIRHGLEPKIDGGEVRIAARRDGPLLVLEVHDDGLGPGASATAGNGVALANLRERLASRYRGGAALQVEAAAPGTRATIRLPYERAAP